MIYIMIVVVNDCNILQHWHEICHGLLYIVTAAYNQAMSIKLGSASKCINSGSLFVSPKAQNMNGWVCQVVLCNQLVSICNDLIFMEQMTLEPIS